MKHIGSTTLALLSCHGRVTTAISAWPPWCRHLSTGQITMGNSPWDNSVLHLPSSITTSEQAVSPDLGPTSSRMAICPTLRWWRWGSCAEVDMARWPWQDGRTEVLVPRCHRPLLSSRWTFLFCWYLHPISALTKLYLHPDRKWGPPKANHLPQKSEEMLQQNRPLYFSST